MHWLKDGDANSKLFHVVANGRRIKNFIPAICHGEELVTDTRTARVRWEPQEEGVMRTAASFPQ
jgi:hypothetical protein